MASSMLPRALIDIDRRRSSSRDAAHLRTGSASASGNLLPPSNQSSPHGSPKNRSPFGSPILRSAMKASHTSLSDPDQSSFSLLDGVEQTTASDPSLVLNEQDTRGRTGLKGSDLPPAGSHSGAVGSMYQRRVGFDTFGSGVELDSTGSQTGGGTGVNYSFSVSAKSAGFCRTKQTRTYMVGTDLNEYSVHALDWVLDSLTDDNDEIVVLRVIDPAEKTKPGGMEEAREEAEQVLEEVMRKNGESLDISIIVEFAIGPIEETIHRMIEIYKPDSLIVGTRGIPDSIFKSAFMGSISRYCVAKSPVPVVVVRPEDKVREALSRRLNEPKKRSYLSLLGPDAPATPEHLLAENTLERSTSGPGPHRAVTTDSTSKKDKATNKALEFKKFKTFS